MHRCMIAMHRFKSLQDPEAPILYR
ncbi:hypothetical protein A2U01_0101301, partial [Trifolium medium]|nr:hypothetical protein [Trifolium medium]